MNKPLILLAVAAVLTAVWYFFLRNKPLTQQTDAGDGKLTPDNEDFLKTLESLNKNIVPTTKAAGGSNDLIKIAQGIQLAGVANKAIQQATGKTLGEIGQDVISDILGKKSGDVASDLLKNATADVMKTAAKPEVANMATKIATLPSVQNAETIEEAVAAADAATGGLSSLASVAIGVAPIALLIAIANAWGVFDKYDPHAEFQKFQLGFDVPELNLKSGDWIDWIPNSIYDKMNANPNQAEQILRGFIGQQIADNEAKQAAKIQIQNNIDADQAAQEALAQAQETARIAQQMADNAATEQARIRAQQLADQAAQAAADAQAAAAAAAYANSQTVKQGNAVKAGRNAGTQFN